MAKTTRVGSVQKFKPIAKINKRRHIQAPKSGVTTVAWNSTDTSFFMNGSFDKKCLVWDTNELVVAHSFRFSSKINVCKMSPSGLHSLLAVGTGEKELNLCDLRLGSIALARSGHDGGITCLSWSPTHENHIVTGSLDGTVRLWDLRKASPLFIFDYLKTRTLDGRTKLGRRNPSTNRKEELILSHQGAVLDVKFLPGGTQVLSAGKDQELRIWDTLDGLNTLKMFEELHIGHSSSGTSISLNSDASVVYVPESQYLSAFEVASGEKIFQTRTLDSITSACFHPSIPELYAGDTSGYISIHSVIEDESKALAKMNALEASNQASSSIHTTTTSNLQRALNIQADPNDTFDINTVVDWNSDEDEFV